MDIKSLNNAIEAYSPNYAAETALANDNATKINEDKEQEKKSTDSFSSESATLSLSEESKESASANGRIVLASEDGIVIEKEKDAAEKVRNSQTEENQVNKSEEVAKEEVAKETVKEDEQIKDLTGYSSNQVETLYREGKVSRNDYEEKMEKLEELKEAATSDDKEKAAEKAREIVEKSAPAESTKTNNENSVKTADKKASEESSDKNKEQIKENIENNKNQVQQLGKVLEDEEETANKAEAYTKAMENDRVDIIDPLFNENAKKQAEVVTTAV